MRDALSLKRFGLAGSLPLGSGDLALNPAASPVFQGELMALAKRCDLPVRKVERWFRCRRNTDRPSLPKKFCEACWRFTFYMVSFFTGLAVLYDVSTQAVPPAPLQPSLFWYYMLELSFYWSLVFTLPFDVKRKDFKEQIVHHAATIFLISFSYCANYIRIGTLVLVIHDASDCFLEPTKIFNYMKWKKTCDSLFMIFSAVFLISRLVIFPYTVLYNTYYYSMEIFQPFFGYYFVNALLIILQLLHVFWSCLIIHMVYKFILQGTVGSRPYALAQARSPRAGCPAPCPDFVYLQGQRLGNPSGHSVPALGHPLSKKVFPDVQREPPVFQFVPAASSPVTGQ
uniref:TLC domain-containing protein n=1 Tax=Athene cunicularia TaxID=194338 RepID=A0A663MPQ5_ATHCN